MEEFQLQFFTILGDLLSSTLGYLLQWCLQLDHPMVQQKEKERTVTLWLFWAFAGKAKFFKLEIGWRQETTIVDHLKPHLRLTPMAPAISLA
jgi:hypothetical protein